MEEPLKRLRSGEKGIKPLHWQLAFPEVFKRGRGGFDTFVGNPPFAGKNTIADGSPDGILNWFKQPHPESHGNADLVAHFFRRCFTCCGPVARWPDCHQHHRPGRYPQQRPALDLPK